MSQETIENTFNVDSIARLTLSNIRGSVKILNGDDNVIKVTAVKHLKSGNSERTKIEITQTDDSTVKVNTKFQQNGWLSFSQRKPCKVDYTVLVPKSCSLQLSAVSNSTVVEGVEGEISINTVSGPVTLENLVGPLKLKTVSGKITGKRVAGPVNLNTVSGRIHIIESQIPRLKGKTVSGSINLQTPLAEGPYELDSVSGNVALVVPPDTACSVRTRSLSGRIKTSLASTGSQNNGGTQRIEVQGGGVEVSFKSVSGGLTLKSTKSTNIEMVAEPEFVTPEKPASHKENIEPPANENQMEILERISNGDLSVKEALEKLS